MPERPFLSIVVPAYNEEQNALIVYEAIRNVCRKLSHRFEIIFVDDGSCDGTFDVLAKLHQADPDVKVIRLTRNHGQTAAMDAGFRLAQGRVIVSMDGDLQNDPQDIPRLLAKLHEGYDVVCGWRKARKDTMFSRQIPSIVANWLIAKITGVPIHDNGCSLKAYRADVIKRVALYSELHRFIPALATLTGARIAEIVVTHHARKFGVSKYGLSRVWSVFFDLFLIRMLTGFSQRPAVWFGTLSVPVLCLATGCLVGISMLNVPGVVLPTAALLLYALAGHFVVMGVFGEMVLMAGNYRPESMIAASALRILP